YALVPAACDDEHLARAIHLRLPKPGLGARRRGGARRQRFAKIERLAAAESNLVERLTQAAQPAALVLHYAAASASTRRFLAKQTSLHAKRRAQARQSRRIFSG